MFHGLPPINDLFDSDVTNELNAAFQGIQEKIDAMEVPPLKYQFTVKEVSVYSSFPEVIKITNRSFRIGKELIVDFDMTLTQDITVPLASTYHIADISETVDRYYGTCCTTAGNVGYSFAILGGSIVLSGTGESIDGCVFHKDIPYHFYGNIILSI